MKIVSFKKTAGSSWSKRNKRRTYIILVFDLDFLFGVVKLCSDPASEYTKRSVALFEQDAAKCNAGAAGEQSQAAYFFSSSSSSLFFSSSWVLA